MNPLQGMTTAEKIVWLFQTRVTEGHRLPITRTLKMEPEQFDQAIPRARDLGVDAGLYITPIYDREGWWTARPTLRIAAIAVRESAIRNLGEAKRNARVYAELKKVSTATSYQEAALAGSLAALEATLPELDYSLSSDYVIADVDAAIAAKRGYVERREQAAA